MGVGTVTVGGAWATGDGLRRRRAARGFGAASRWAAVRADIRVASSTIARSHRVAPIRPQPPGTGLKAAGTCSQKKSRRSGSNIRLMSWPTSSSVAKVFRGVRKAVLWKWGAEVTASNVAMSAFTRAISTPIAALLPWFGHSYNDLRPLASSS
ncbi:MAG: hypothetical protein PGN33_17880 [Methylobacterium radiotolerans]